MDIEQKVEKLEKDIEHLETIINCQKELILQMQNEIRYLEGVIASIWR